MATIPFTSIAGQTLKPPIDITTRSMQSAGNFRWDQSLSHGLIQTASVTSTTLTEVINVTGSGVITFLVLIAAVDASVNPFKLRVVIDGVTCVDLTSGNVNGERCTCVVGGLLQDASSDSSYTGFGHFAEEVAFHKSLVVSIAGDGADQAKIIWSRYLT